MTMSNNDIKRLDSTNWKEYASKLAGLRSELNTGVPAGSVISRLHRLFDEYSQPMVGKLADIEESFNMMCGFLLKGVKDEHRGALYVQLSKRLYKLIVDALVDVKLKFDKSAALFATVPNTQELDVEDLRARLESFVSDLAMLEIEPEEGREARGKALYESRQAIVSRAFVSIVKSRQWSRELASDMKGLLLSPTIDSVDARLLCSAILMAALFEPDAAKVITLMSIYQEATDVRLRQRALVGWVLALDGGNYSLFDEIGERLNVLLRDKDVRSEVMELQIQIVYCMNADRDEETIRKNLMPTIMKNQSFEVSRYGIREKEEDPMEDILHGDETDKKMEELEKAMQKVVDMQKKGADIYFGGFSKMKRFGFFYTLCNWFMPFYTRHPGLEDLPSKLKESGFMAAIVKDAPFCDSDKYSFALSLRSVYSQLPENIREMLNGATFKMSEYTGDTSSPVVVRRLYLQDLYRFFRINDSRKAFYNPFSGKNGHLFIANALYKPLMHDEATHVVRNLLKRHQYVEATNILGIFFDGSNAEDLQLNGRLALVERRYADAEALFEKAFEKADDIDSMKGYALASFRRGHYVKAIELYQRLSKACPDNYNYRLYTSISLINDGRAEEGVKSLYELYYKLPDNADVLRAMGWGLLALGNVDKAKKMYQEILQSEDKTSADYLNAGYCMWFAGDVSKAVSLFKKYKKAAGKNPDAVADIDNNSLLNRFKEDSSLLDKYNIATVDRLLVAGMAEGA